MNCTKTWVLLSLTFFEIALSILTDDWLVTLEGGTSLARAAILSVAFPPFIVTAVAHLVIIYIFGVMCL